MLQRMFSSNPYVIAPTSCLSEMCCHVQSHQSYLKGLKDQNGCEQGKTSSDPPLQELAFHCESKYLLYLYTDVHDHIHVVQGQYVHADDAMSTICTHMHTFVYTS